MADKDAIRFVRTVIGLQSRKATGVLEVCCDQNVARVAFLDGVLVYVEHKSLGRTFGAYLIDRELLSRAQYEELAAEIRLRGAASPMFGLIELAIARQMLAPAHASTLIQGQVERNFAAMFGWARFECCFSSERALVTRLPRFPCKLEALVLQGIRNRFGTQAARAALLSRQAHRPSLRPTPSEVVRTFRLQPAELTVVRTIDGRRTVSELLSHPDLDAHATACVLLAFELAGVLAWAERLGGGGRTGESSPRRGTPPRPIARLSLRSVRVTLPAPPSAEETAAASAFRRALAHSRAGELLAAQRELEHALAAVDHPEYGLHKAWVDSEIRGGMVDPETVQKLSDAARRALRHDPTLAFGYFVVGHLHLEQGDVHNAELAFRRASRLDPSDGRARAAREKLLDEGGSE